MDNKPGPSSQELRKPEKDRLILASEDDTVVLKQLIPADADPYFDLIEADRAHLSQHGDKTAAKYKTVDDVRDSIVTPKDSSKLRFGIWDGNVMVGSNNLTPTEDGQAELGSWVGSEFIGQRYAGRARKLLVEYAFDQLGLKEVFCMITIGNEASRRSVERSGFTYAGEEDGQWKYVLENPSIIPESSPSGEVKDESVEVPLKGRGAGAIFHIKDTDQFMFFLRDDKDWIPYPNMVDIIGGHAEDGETAEEAALREFREELDELDTGEPFQPPEITLFQRWVDDRNVEQNIFGCELETMPNLHLKEGQRLLFLSREELATTEFAFHYNQVVQEYAASV